MITHRIFRNLDADEVANLVKETMLTTNIKDYSEEYLNNDLNRLYSTFLFLLPIKVKLIDNLFKYWKRMNTLNVLNGLEFLLQ